jgi:aspartyl-tRNA(Asn)/glutamyl-tRNA(Gln) amidotransferase subunit C
MSNKSDVNINYLAKLARLDLSDAEKQKFSAQLVNVLGYVEQLNKADTSKVKATAHAFDVFNVWREDVPGATFTPEEALRNAPAQRDNEVEVPVVVDDI